MYKLKYKFFKQYIYKSQAEQKPKGFGIFNIGKSEYNFTQHYLKESFRPVMFMELELSEIIKQ